MTTADDFVIQILVDRNLVTAEAVDALRNELSQDSSVLDMDATILARFVSDEVLSQLEITQALADEFNMELVDLSSLSPPPELLRVIDSDLAARCQVFPLWQNGGELEIAISDPLNVDVVDSLSHVTSMTISTRLATPDQIKAAIKKFYGGGYSDEENELFDAVDESSSASLLSNLDDDMDPNDAGPIIQYVQGVIEDAIARRASDIHMEPLEKRFRIRYRVDGKLTEIENPPKRLQPAILARIKLMANVKLAEKRVPQDGRIQYKGSSKVIDLRVSVLPTAHGESIVMRILDKEGLNLGMSELGFFSDDQATFERIINTPDGVFLVTGPTGSGKSTTLYTGLHTVNKSDRKIITVEDPVEYEMVGINQVQVRKEVNMTFSSALRAMLRQAPNIIMVGEIRDLETAEIAINASLTGHMVFSTLHTNDAPSAVTRLIDIGVKPFLVSAALRAAMAQRLIRQIHPDCKEAYQPEVKELTALGMDPSQASTLSFMRAVPKAGISDTGYKGRKGIFEIFAVDDEMAQMIYEKRTLVELRKKALDSGMRTMRSDGIRKIVAGITSVEEVLSVTVDAM